jgi:predicted transcriptional regulator
MPRTGQQKGTPARRAAFIEMLRSMGDGPECVYWPWSDLRDTYASVHVDGVKVRASRWVYEQLHGPLPERHGRGARGVLVMHTCDNPPCVRHLVAGTQDDNMKDAAAKGRMPGGKSNHRPRLSPRDVAAIMADLADGKMLQVDVARKYGVSQATISKMATGKRGSRRVKPFTDEQVAVIVSMKEGGVRVATIARSLGVTRAIVEGAIRRVG